MMKYSELKADLMGMFDEKNCRCFRRNGVF